MRQPQAPIARHEAAHAVVAHLLGARIRKIGLSAESQEEGLANIDRNGVSLDAIRQILFAGSLAEIKCRASARLGCSVVFDVDQITGLEQVAYEDDFLEEHNPAVAFRKAGNQPTTFTPTQGNEFSDFESFCDSDLREMTARGDFGRCLREVIGRLDDPVVWGQVEVVAAELLKTGTVSAERFLELVAPPSPLLGS